MTDEQAATLLALVREIPAEPLCAWIRHLHRCATGHGYGDSTVRLLTDLGAAADDAAMLVDDAMSDRLDRSARAKVENSGGR